MTEWQTARRLARTAQKWRDLVDLRCLHLIELHKTGRWKRYYGEAQFRVLMSEAVALAQIWARIAPRPDVEYETAPAEAGSADDR
jgi:hypothetical protein